VGTIPVQAAKVKAPALREETLSRERLLDWLRGKINHRVILVTAEAGYGKTTLLADFSRRSRQRSLWYRLDEGDQSWVGLLSYLIAAGREFVPAFGQATVSLLREVGPGGPTRETVIDTFLRELVVFEDGPTVLILDDVHLVDHADDFTYLLRRVVERMPARMTLILSSRRSPKVRLGRLRGQAEVVELTGADLRFDNNEIDRLFRDSYRQPLEPDVLSEVARRTEGWAASLELIHAALHEREPSEARGLVAELSGSKGEIYDYLAEEVIGDLPPEFQHFLMRSSVLERLDEELLSLTTALDVESVRRNMDEVERLGLIARRNSRSGNGRRYHHLVREFLDARLRAEAGDGEVAELHRRVALAVESRDWALACRHLAAAGDTGDIPRVIDGAIARIMATGDYAQAESVIDDLEVEPIPASFLIIRSRMELRRGDSTNAVALARQASLPGSSDVDWMNLASVLLTAGRIEDALSALSEAVSRVADGRLRELARVSVRLIRTSLDESVTDTATDLRRIAAREMRAGAAHYAGVAKLNLAVNLLHAGEMEQSLRSADDAQRLLAGAGSLIELGSAELARAWALAHMGRLEAARNAYRIAAEQVHGRFLIEARCEAAVIEALYGDLSRATDFLDDMPSDMGDDPDSAELNEMAHLRVAIRKVDLSALESRMPRLRFGHLSGENSAEVRRHCLFVHGSVLLSRDSADQHIDEAIELAEAQGSHLWLRYLRLLRATRGPSDAFETSVRHTLRDDEGTFAFLLESVLARLDDLSSATFEALSRVALRHPERWRSALRQQIESTPDHRSIRSAEILDSVGEREDIVRLRAFSRAIKRRGNDVFGLRLSRKLADRVFVEDQGRVVIQVGNREIQGASVRRKVLGLVCFLLTKPSRSAVRDEVLEALWPDLDPLVAMNSLNQTIYFLRRVFEPRYSEELSPGYVHHQSDVLWLDPELVDSRSMRCAALIRLATRQPDSNHVDELSEMYRGRFALEFAYEEWASGHRDWMHANYLQLVEAAVSQDLAVGQFEHGIGLARRALEVDPEADELELSLLRLYRGIGATAAAAEQYSHYAAVAREDLGIEPPALETL
jgi:ATP/maltotriose-dependent transcriptional regulator MalT/two-component SAPR family response regulator